MTNWVTACSMGNCPQYRHVDGRVEIRDSTRPGEVAWFSEAAWAVFVDHLRNTEPLKRPESFAGRRASTEVPERH